MKTLSYAEEIAYAVWHADATKRAWITRARVDLVRQVLCALSENVSEEMILAGGDQMEDWDGDPKWPSAVFRAMIAVALRGGQ